MSWSDLKLLLAFEERGTLQDAANAEGLNASTVSRRLRALEARLGAAVVENVGGRLALTEVGVRAVRAAREMRHHVDALQRETSGRDQELEGVLRLGLLEVFVRYHRELFASFAARHPAVQLELLSHGPRLHSLTRREVDVVLRVSRQPDETLVGRRVMALQYAVFGHETLASGSFDPGRLPWIGWDPAMFARVNDEWLRLNAAPGSIRARVTSTVAMLDLAKAGVGACIVPTLYGRLSGLTPLTSPLEGFETWVWCLTHRDLVRNARVRAFTDHIVSGFRAAAATTDS